MPDGAEVERERGPRRAGRLDTVRQIQVEAGKLYRRCLREDIPTEIARTAIQALRLVLDAARVQEVEVRLLELERLLEGNPAATITLKRAA